MLNDLIPIFGLVERLIRIEPHRRLPGEVYALIRPFHAALDLERRAAAEHSAGRVALSAAGGLPRSGEVGLAVRQPRRRRLRGFGVQLRLIAAEPAGLCLQRCRAETENEAKGDREPRADE